MRVLITSGPTRQYIDPVRYLTNASSGQMGAALAEAAISLGHDVVVVSGPVSIQYPEAAKVVHVQTTQELLEACQQEFPSCGGAIAAAAPCDYQPVEVRQDKLAKTGEILSLELKETADVAATLGASKRDDQWLVVFALETSDHNAKALQKLKRKSGDLIVVNGPAAMDSATTDVEVLGMDGKSHGRFHGSKREVAAALFRIISQEL